MNPHLFSSFPTVSLGRIDFPFRFSTGTSINSSFSSKFLDSFDLLGDDHRFKEINLIIYIYMVFSGFLVLKTARLLLQAY
jgi:hypothetical protein